MLFLSSPLFHLFPSVSPLRLSPPPPLRTSPPIHSVRQRELKEGKGPWEMTLAETKLGPHANLAPTSCPGLLVARAFGDFAFKQNDRLSAGEQAISAVPDVDVYPRADTDAFVVLASDGIFDFMSNDEVVDFLGTRLGYTMYGAPRGGVSVEDLAEACDLLVHHCLEKGSSISRADNLCVVVVLLGGGAGVGDVVGGGNSNSGGSPAQTPRHQPVLTPSSGTANATPVAQTLTRVFEAGTLDTSADEGVVDVAAVSRQLSF